MKKSCAIVLIFALLLSFSACTSSKTDDPNVGMWNAVSATMMGVRMETSSLFDSGVTLEIKANGKFTINVDGDKGSGKWIYDGSDLKLTASGVDMTATVSNGVLTLTNLLDMGIDITFEKDG